MELMRCAVLVLALAAGCSDPRPVAPDAAVDAAVDALPPGTPDYYGEPCSQPSTLGVVVTCRRDDPYPAAYCTPEGTCRPFCSHVSVAGEGFSTCKAVGGVETWAFSTSAARVCYCAPPG